MSGLVWDKENGHRVVSGSLTMTDYAYPSVTSGPGYAQPSARPVHPDGRPYSYPHYDLNHRWVAGPPEVSPTVTTPVRLVGIWAPAPQSGKTTARNAIIAALGNRGVSIAFADPMRRIIRALLEEMDVSDQKIVAYMTIGALKEEPIPGVGKSFVELAIKIGTDLGRGWLGESTWVDMFRGQTRRALLHTPNAVVVVDDVRFPNEAAVIRELGGVMIGVERNGATVSAQRAAGEGLLTYNDMDRTMTNHGLLEAFQKRVVFAARSLGVPL